MRKLLGILWQWSCQYCHSGPFPEEQFICGHCGMGKNA